VRGHTKESIPVFIIMYLNTETGKRSESAAKAVGPHTAEFADEFVAKLNEGSALMQLPYTYYKTPVLDI